MAAAFIHYFLGVGLAYLFGYTGLDALLLGLVGAVQDLDFISFFFYKQVMKTKYSQLLMHRGMTHTVWFPFLCSGLLIFNPAISALVFINFMLHIFTDYVTAWGVSPFIPFSTKRYSLGLMTIFDIPLVTVSFFVGVAGFVSVNLVVAFAAFFGYIFLRFVLKQRLKYNDLTPMGNITYAFCIPEDDYIVGKVDILGREETISVKKCESDIDSVLLEKVESTVGRSPLFHLMEYPTYTIEGDSVKIKDARSYLFPKSNRFGFMVFFDRESEKLYVQIAGRRVELPIENL